MGYDIIGDIHGHAEELEQLLKSLGYTTHGKGYQHASRKVVFVGDFVDRGPAIARVIEIVRAIVSDGNGHAAMGNHEFNAIAFHTPKPDRSGGHFREHSQKNLTQHDATLKQLTTSQLSDALAWFKQLPVALELDGIRVAHAAWQTRDIQCIENSLRRIGLFNQDFLTEAENKQRPLYRAIENVLKGPELKLPGSETISDKGGHSRSSVRIKWYESGAGRTYREHHLGGDNVPDIKIDPQHLAELEVYPADAAPLFIGHYWMSGAPAPLAPNVACTDYSVAKDGKLVAYRWDGEKTLSADKDHWVKNS
jgi:hypothetical protein